jgi:hypothetical protein
MKKAYIKPMISFESFKMSSSIAGTCDDGFQTNSGTIHSCEYIYNGMSLFGNSNGDCFFKNDETTCYHVPIDGIVLFGS